MRKIILEDEDAEIDSVKTGEGGGKGETADRVIRAATEDIPASVAKDEHPTLQAVRRRPGFPAVRQPVSS
ncbi:MAG: hypothetical protein OXR82_18255 [Gammaproteobacteria bacterium]|nr:hypothetical protein [Gammaproteobacteria bacterium]